MMIARQPPAFLPPEEARAAEDLKSCASEQRVEPIAVPVKPRDVRERLAGMRSRSHYCALRSQSTV